MLGPTHTERGRAVTTARGGGVQSVERVFELLERTAQAGGTAGLSELAAATGLPMPTVHRLMNTLVQLGYLRREPARRYALGPRLIQLGDIAAQQLERAVKPHLVRLVGQAGESANMALLDGDEIIYVAQASSQHAMRMHTEVGKRFLPHCTGVGKALLAQLPPAKVRAIVQRTGMPALTQNTITDPDAFLEHLSQVRQQGWACDDAEQELGVRCYAIAIEGAPAPTALSITGPAVRVTEETRDHLLSLMRGTARAIAQELTSAEG